MVKRHLLPVCFFLVLLAGFMIMPAVLFALADPDPGSGTDKSSTQPIIFRFIPPAEVQASTVSLRGSFNGWGETPLILQDDNSWLVTLDLGPGQYQYKYFIDGKWPPNMEQGFGGFPIDLEAHGYVGDGFGGQNAVRIVSAGTPTNPSREAELNVRMDAMKRSIADASFAIYPIIFRNKTMPRVAELAAVFLERSDVRKINVMERPFNVSAQSTIWNNAKVFGAFVGNSSMEEDYAILGEYRGGCGAQGEIRCIVVDKQGQPVWVDRHVLEKDQFNPMVCTYLMVDRLRTRLGLPDPEREDATEGPWAKLWRESSGTPDDSEIAKMEGRLRSLQSGFAKATVWIFPIRVGDSLDREGAIVLASLLSEKGLCQAMQAPVDIRVEYEPASDEQRMLWDLARGFRDHAQKMDLKADYGLFAEYFLDSRSNKAHAVHFVLCDANGQWVIVDFQNSHQADFQEINPATADDCSRLVLKRLQSYLQ